MKMRIDEIAEVTGKTRKEVENILSKEDFIKLELTE